MTYIKILLCCYYVCWSLTFAASQLASLILGDERNQVTSTTSVLQMSALIEWIRNGNKLSTTQCETMTVESVTDGFSVFNCSFDYLYRDKKLAILCAMPFIFLTLKFPFVHFFEARIDICHNLISSYLIRSMEHIA